MTRIQDAVLTNARLVLEDRVLDGTVVVENGMIARVDEGKSSLPGAIDFHGDYLLPGLVELHTDNLEKHFVPRPGTRWPAMAAIVGHDAQVASAGITTVFDALCVGETSSGGDRLEILAGMANSIREARSKHLLRSDHLLHLRCEISHPDTASLFREFIGDPGLKMVSIMDHTPGQRQFTTIDKYKYYYVKKHGWSDAEFTKFVTQQTEASARYGASNRRTIVALAHENGLTLASHDDATVAHVDEAIADGMVVAEFPTTMDAAEASRGRGMAILMGAPNVVRGGSHSGNVSALDLARDGLLDILSSDYVPMSLIHGAFILSRAGVGFDLPAAIRTVTATPATRVGLTDRGRIAAGLRADLVRVRDTGDMPLVRGVWCRGERVILPPPSPFFVTGLIRRGPPYLQACAIRNLENKNVSHEASDHRRHACPRHGHRGWGLGPDGRLRATARRRSAAADRAGVEVRSAVDRRGRQARAGRGAYRSDGIERRQERQPVGGREGAHPERPESRKRRVPCRQDQRDHRQSEQRIEPAHAGRRGAERPPGPAHRAGYPVRPADQPRGRPDRSRPGASGSLGGGRQRQWPCERRRAGADPADREPAEQHIYRAKHNGRTRG